LHVGHGRGAVLGSTLANVLGAAGYDVQREYYINDQGNQIDAFARTLYARYLEVLALTGNERVLEVGTGSGYQTVLLAHLAAQVFSIERIPALFNMAREAIQRSGVRNVNLLLGDGTVGWREYSPYDAILVGAGAPAIPQPLVEQLAVRPGERVATFAWNTQRHLERYYGVSGIGAVLLAIP